MDDLTIDEVKQLVNFYRQRASDLEFSNLQWQIRYNKLLTSSAESVPATKVIKTKP
jgi:hypothetical protein